MKRRPCGTVRDSKSGRVYCRTTEELEIGHKDNGRGIEEHEKAIWQEKAKSLKTEGWRQHVAREQKYPIELTLKEVGQ